MNEEQKQKILEKYHQAKQKGVKFWPDIIYKDLLVTFAIFIVLIMLATFIGVANEPKADPSDTSYIPRPEWYFLFLFELLKYFPGQIEWVGTFVLPSLVILALFLLPFFDRNTSRFWRNRKFAISLMTVIVFGMVAMTIMAVASTPPQPETGTVATTLGEKISAGTDLYSIHCVECHGADGEGGEIKGVEGLEGVVLKSISSQDEMYTRTDDTLYNIISYGQPNLGMPPFAKAFGGELGPGDIETIVAFMRYTWDDRAEIPQEVVQAAAPAPLAPDEVPSYEVHIAPLVKRYCISCHRPGKTNNNYFMDSYEETMQSGDNAPNIIPGELSCNLIRMLNREDIPAGGPMPPTKSLKPEQIDLFIRWVLGGAPNTADEAAAVSPGTVLTTTVTVPLPTAIPESTATPAP